MSEEDHLWDSSRPGSDEAFDRKYEEWEKRHWMTWLAENLVFPFKATREEDEDDAYFQEGAARALFRLGPRWKLRAWRRKMTCAAFRSDSPIPADRFPAM